MDFAGMGSRSILSFARSVPFRLLIPAALNSGSDRGEALGEETSIIGIAAHVLVPRDLVKDCSSARVASRRGKMPSSDKMRAEKAG